MKTIFLLLLTTTFGSAHAQLRPVTVHPRGSGETLSISASPASLTFNLVPRGTATSTTSPTITVSWTVTQTRSLSVYAFFNSSSSALSGSSPVVAIPSSAVLAYSFNTNGYAAFTQTNPFNGVSASVALLSSYSISGSSSVSGSVPLQINLSSLPQLPASTYTGVLYLQVQAN